MCFDVQNNKWCLHRICDTIKPINPPHIIIPVVYIFICLYFIIFPVPRIVATALNI